MDIGCWQLINGNPSSKKSRIEVGFTSTKSEYVDKGVWYSFANYGKINSREKGSRKNYGVKETDSGLQIKIYLDLRRGVAFENIKQDENIKPCN